jgi:hypothetical protein
VDICWRTGAGITTDEDIIDENAASTARRSAHARGCAAGEKGSEACYLASEERRVQVKLLRQIIAPSLAAFEQRQGL